MARVVIALGTANATLWQSFQRLTSVVNGGFGVYVMPHQIGAYPTKLRREDFHSANFFLGSAVGSVQEVSAGLAACKFVQDNLRQLGSSIPMAIVVDKSGYIAMKNANLATRPVRLLVSVSERHAFEGLARYGTNRAKCKHTRSLDWTDSEIGEIKDALGYATNYVNWGM